MADRLRREHRLRIHTFNHTYINTHTPHTHVSTETPASSAFTKRGTASKTTKLVVTECKPGCRGSAATTPSHATITEHATNHQNTPHPPEQNNQSGCIGREGGDRSGAALKDDETVLNGNHSLEAHFATHRCCEARLAVAPHELPPGMRSVARPFTHHHTVHPLILKPGPLPLHPRP